MTGRRGLQDAVERAAEALEVCRGVAGPSFRNIVIIGFDGREESNSGRRRLWKNIVCICIMMYYVYIYIYTHTYINTYTGYIIVIMYS